MNVKNYQFLGYLLHWYGTTTHKLRVLLYIFKFCIKLMIRAFKHDLSKYSIIEAKFFAQTIRKLKSSTYGSLEYQTLLESIKPSLDHHYKANSHHPEHFLLGIRGMNLLDIVEMYYDWQSAVKRHKNGNILKSIEHNQDRFNMSNDITEIFLNSI